MRDTPLFLGMTKPPRIFGLPIGYFVALVFASVIPFILVDDMRFLLVFLAGYPPLWVVADRNPHLFQILNVVMSRTPRTSVRSRDGGDLYVA
ncbi:hypothetical protein A8B82_21530 [Sulfitobacter sp. EhC04]|uniref:type IV secretion system protein VirB3 n=1 Tax=Sulfitobacter sp. EhC04 TaxID=1849168 RepID=UPI0007F36DD8|nr:VirB3 family type IV secretion system protein [Sulfitobacter sp. EhC04]OAN71010.1 hypothetical protein A8B82_21530 [Sulfitobacter sp. EhC04]